MRIALVTFSFTPESPGGVSTVLIRILDILQSNLTAKIDIFSFRNSRDKTRPKQFFRGSRELTSQTARIGSYENCDIFEIESFFSSLEVMRYRKRTELQEKFESYDLVIVVTGILQFVNVIPVISRPILVQCATRLKWERKSQYPEMSLLKRVVLKLQVPILAIMERRVVRSKARFLTENVRTGDWIAKRSISPPDLWYPPVANSEAKMVLPGVAKNYFISVGRFNDRRKGWSRLVDAYALAVSACPDLPELIIIGWGDFPEYLRRKLKLLETQCQIYIFPNLSNSERDRYLTGASYFLQTSFEEGLGIAALEALRVGTPLICSDTDGSREYIRDGITGARVPQGRRFTKAFSEKLIEAQTWDHKRLRETSLEFFEKNFSKDISTAKFLQLISRIVD